MTDDDFYLRVEFPLMLQISGVLAGSPEYQKLDHLMDAFRPYLKELHALQRRSAIRRVK